jgi:hypothetical protein
MKWTSPPSILPRHWLANNQRGYNRQEFNRKSCLQPRLLAKEFDRKNRIVSCSILTQNHVVRKKEESCSRFVL